MISSDDLIEELFGDCVANGNFDVMNERRDLTSTNKEVSKINAITVDCFPWEYKSDKSYDFMKDKQEGWTEFIPELLIGTADLPLHYLTM